MNDLEAEELQRLTDRWRGPLIGYLASQGAGYDEAIELALDCFAEAWLGRERFRGDFEDLEATGAYLRGIARNLWRTRLRTRRQDRERHVSEVELDTIAAEVVRESQDREQIDQLHRAIERLGSEHRALLTMHYFEETSHRVVGGLLGISERAVEGRLRRARKALERELRYSKRTKRVEVSR